MEALLLGAKGISVINQIGFDIVVGTLTTTTTSVVNGVKYLASYDQPGAKDVANTLAEIDLEFIVSVIDELVKEQSDSIVNGSHVGSVTKALEGVNGILQSIDKELIVIKKALENHKTKYFNSWRTFDCSCNIETIKKHKVILDNRYKILTDLLKIYNKNVRTNKAEIEKEQDMLKNLT